MTVAATTGAIGLTPSSAPRLYSIVVLGAMNPRLHYPMWYSAIGALTDEEAIAGRESPAFLINPFSSQFGFGDFQIVCLLDRWEIRTSNEQHRSRILDIASRVFEKLFETPISAFGFNTWADLDTTHPKVSEVLGDLAIRTGLGFSSDGEKSCQFIYTSADASHAITVTVRPSAVRESMVWVAYNTHIALGEKGTHFDLTPHLKKNFDPHWKEAIAFGQGVVAKISGYSGVLHGN